MDTKYIQIRHQDYWEAFYDLKPGQIRDVEFNLSNDSAGENIFFWLELFNKSYCNEQGAFDDDYYPEDLSALVDAFNMDEIPFFVSAVYYPTPEKTSVYRPDDFLGKTIFDMKRLATPYYSHIAVAEEEGLLPERLIYWLSVLSIPLFGEQFQFEFSEIPSQEAVAKALKW